MKTLITLILISTGFIAKADVLGCKYVSSHNEMTNGFLTNSTAEFDCNGVTTQFIGDNIYVSCKPQFVLSQFTEKLMPGENVEFKVAIRSVSSIDGSSKDVMMVRSAVSESGKVLVPQTIIQHGKPVQCDPTQIEVR